MADLVNRITVFLASPGDVAQEREIVRDTIDQFNQNAVLGENTIVQLKRWETHAWPGFGEDAQAVINQQIGPYDVFVGIMWNRIGTPTGRAASGTVEEFERAYAAWKQHKRPSLMFYFNRLPSDLGTQDELQQKMDVLGFKKVLQSSGALYWEYNSVEEFRKLISGHLLNELRRHASSLKETSVSPAQPESFIDAENWPYLLKVGSWNFELDKKLISGSGVYEFLLSKNIYGKRDFRVKADLAFQNYEKHRNSGMETANAGIVLGWQENSRGHQYYNVLLTGSRLLLEAIGFEGSDDYGDSKHLNEGVKLELSDDRTYDFGLSVTQAAIDVFVDNILRYSVSVPRDLHGRVGLRPWKSKVLCSKFMVSEN
jgi:hypothetical protein